MADDGMIRDHLFSRVFNFRDVGGLKGLDGRTVRWRRLFRSDSLSGLTDTEREAFSKLGVRTVLDLRRPAEVERDGRAPEWDLNYHHVHPEHQEWHVYPWDSERDELSRWLADRYLNLAEEGRAGLGRAVSVIAEPENAPVVVHCVAGKDRTGVVCALTLSAIGVDDEQIAADYALSTAGSERYVEWRRAQQKDLDAMPPARYFVSPPEAMLTFLRDLRARHGSVAGYLAEAGVTDRQIAALRANLLTPS